MNTYIKYYLYTYLEGRLHRKEIKERILDGKVNPSLWIKWMNRTASFGGPTTQELVLIESKPLWSDLTGWHKHNIFTIIDNCLSYGGDINLAVSKYCSENNLDFNSKVRDLVQLGKDEFIESCLGV